MEYCLILICNIFFLNIIIESVDNPSPEKILPLSYVSLWTVVIFLLLEITLDFYLFILTVISLVLNILITSRLSVETLKKMGKYNKKATELIMRLGNWLFYIISTIAIVVALFNYWK